MVIYALDTETYEWNENKQVYKPDLNYNSLFTVVTDEKYNSITFMKNEGLWEWLIKKGKEHKNNKNLMTVYGHNMQFDFYKIINKKYMKNIKIFSNKPFIASYYENNKEVIKFLDSMGLFRMALKDIGEILEFNKTEIPTNILNNKSKFVQESIINEYCKNDTKIIIKGIEKIKEMVKETGVIIRRYVTISQIANTIVLSLMSKYFKDKKDNPIFYDNDRRYTIKSDNHEIIRNAYRGGKCEAYRLGTYDYVNYIDINSLYPNSAINMKFPNLGTERVIKQPMRNGLTFLDKIGVSKVMIKNVCDEYGFLGVRTGTDNHYLNIKQIGIGTWNNNEIKHAINNGYELIDCEWSIIYDEGDNPYKEIINMLYEKKRNSKNKFEEFFYKSIMNHSFGKLAQYKPYVEYRIDDIEEAERYIKRNYEMIAGTEYDRVFRKEYEYEMKTYYAPLIVAIITADSRIKMHQEMKKIPKELILYTDTDSIFFQGNHYLDKFNIGNNIGDFKIVSLNNEMNIKGRKTYMLNKKEIKVSGFYKSDLNAEDFEKGIIKSKKMNTIKTTPNIEEWGKFKINERNLTNQVMRLLQIKDMYNEQKVLVDYKEKDIEYFYEEILNVV